VVGGTFRNMGWSAWQEAVASTSRPSYAFYNGAWRCIERPMNRSEGLKACYALLPEANAMTPAFTQCTVWCTGNVGVQGSS
jgi:hypothetical protein